jgi:hypothetical protein
MPLFLGGAFWQVLNELVILHRAGLMKGQGQKQ